MSDKNWRMTEDEVKYKLEKILDDRIEYMVENLSNLDKCIRDEKMGSKRYVMIRDMLKYIDNTKSLTLDDIIKYKIAIYSVDIDNWTQSSLSPKSEEEIIVKILGQQMYKKFGDLICLSYACASKLMTEDLLSDILYIQSDNFSFKTWDDEHVNAYVDAACSSKTLDKNQIDWRAIAINENFDIKTSKFRFAMEDNISDWGRYVDAEEY